MRRIGFLSLYVPGHVHPSLALAAHLAERGHEVVYFNLLDVAAACERAGVRHVPYGQQSFPLGAVKAAQARMGGLEGQASFAFFLERMALLMGAAFAEVPELVRSEEVELLVVDQLFPGGATVAERAGVPFASLAAALLVNREDGVPPPIFAWPYDPSPQGLGRNRQGWAGVAQAFAPLLAKENAQRAEWGLAPHEDYLEDGFSPLLQIAQQPPSLEFPRAALPPVAHMVGPLRRAGVAPPAPFDWGTLDGRPLVYASMGTLQNGLPRVFAAILAALGELPVQAVLSLGGGEPELPPIPGNVQVMSYAPQAELLGRAALCITHAGLNTATDCLAAGVPMVCVPIASEQPGIAARVAWLGAGVVVPLAELSAQRLQAAVEEVLREGRYAECAREQAEALRALPPSLHRAAELLDRL